jgi:RTX calcium-binding nonapeptide repeat (4 copies)
MSKAWTRAALATGLLMVVGAPAALAGAGGARQDPAQLKFTTGQPSSATGASILIDYVNPSDPSAKPFGVDRVETIFHRGTKIDTSVPAQCDPARAGAVPNDQCPAGSEVGGGTLRFDQGNGPAVSPAFPRILRFRVTLFNAPNLVLFRLDGTNNPIRGLLAPSEVRGGRTIRAEVPHLPGGPPDNQIAIDLANIRYKRISNPRGNYITTPASCPRIGAWTNRLTFSYNDDANPDFEVVQSPRTRSGCASGGGAGGGGGPGRTIAGTAGDDVLRGTAANDRILCGGGYDRVEAGGGNDIVLCGSGDDVVHGGSGDDELHGESGGDDLFGEEGDDELDGASGNDRLVGGPGRDELRPGSGRNSSTHRRLPVIRMGA